eukprot:6197793-Pleurochrysis_carterae.AAC.1
MLRAFRLKKTEAARAGSALIEALARVDVLEESEPEPEADCAWCAACAAFAACVCSARIEHPAGHAFDSPSSTWMVSSASIERAAAAHSATEAMAASTAQSPTSVASYAAPSSTLLTRVVSGHSSRPE